MSLDTAELSRAARGGRVAHTGFLEPDEAAAAAARLRQEGLKVTLDGGFEGARRRVLTAYPEHLPYAGAALAAVYFAGAEGESEVRAALRRQGVPEDAIGDVVRHQDGLSVILLKTSLQAVLKVTRVGHVGVSPEEMALEHYAGKSARSLQVIVPSLRVDALGAKAFKVSRAYFSKGMAGGKVSLNGKTVSKAAVAAAGDEVNATGLGRFRVERVEGETKRGNLKVVLTVEKG